MLAGDMPPRHRDAIGVMGMRSSRTSAQPEALHQADHYDMSDFYGPALELQYVKSKLIGLPLGVYPSAVYYNEDMFDAAGVPYPPHEFGCPRLDLWTSWWRSPRKLTLDVNGHDATSPDFPISEHIIQWGWDGWPWIPSAWCPPSSRRLHRDECQLPHCRDEFRPWQMTIL